MEDLRSRNIFTSRNLVFEEKKVESNGDWWTRPDQSQNDDARDIDVESNTEHEPLESGDSGNTSSLTESKTSDEVEVKRRMSMLWEGLRVYRL